MTPARTVLLVAFHFPPVKGSSGLQRTLRFARYLPEYGWRPVVLTIDPRAYEQVATTEGNEVPEGLEVHRAFGLDTARSLSIGGRYPRSLALPDRWATWRPWAVRRGLRIVRASRIDAVWSTFPIATAHRIGLDIATRSRLPWIAEFRDPMWQGDYPPDPQVNRYWRELEGEIFSLADAVVVTAPSAVSFYAERFPRFDRSRIALIENGYDEETFERAQADLAPSDLSPRENRGLGCPITLVHSGLIYPSERDPTQLFAALASMKRRGLVSARELQVVLRASGNEAQYRGRLAEQEIADIVRIEPGIPYVEALKEMLTADGLLILQASNCNAQVPAKLYEYIRAQRPILALTDPAGDTAHTLERARTGRIVPLDSAGEIETALLDFIEEIRHDSWRRASGATIASFSRKAQTEQFAARLTEAVDMRMSASA